jgi:hypothetical protein
MRRPDAASGGNERPKGSADMSTVHPTLGPAWLGRSRAWLAGAVLVAGLGTGIALVAIDDSNSPPATTQHVTTPAVAPHEDPLVSRFGVPQQEYHAGNTDLGPHAR